MPPRPSVILWPRRPILGWRARTCALGLGVLRALGGTALAQDGGNAGLKNGSGRGVLYGRQIRYTAVRQLTAAINSGTLAPERAARAFYLRGMAYRKLNQPSHAIADLGAAVWLGLPAPDRASAQVNRALSYRAAGLATEADAELASARKAGGSQVDTLLAENGGGNDASVAAFSTELHVEKEPPPAPPTRTRGSLRPMDHVGRHAAGARRATKAAGARRRELGNLGRHAGGARERRRRTA